MPADLTNADDVRRMADEALSPRGAIDILVNNTGVSILGGVAELTRGRVAARDRYQPHQRLSGL